MATTGTTTPTGALGTESSLSNWVGPYATNMLGKAEALSEMPYQTYQGPLTAGASPLQTQGFQQAASLTTPGAVGAAANTLGGIASTLQNQAPYQGATFGNQYSAPGQYQSGAFNSGYSALPGYQAGAFGSQYSAPTAYQAGEFSNSYQQGADYDPTKFNTQMFGTAQAQQYMNPFIQTALNPALDESRRQADIARLSDAARLTKAGAYGGSRQAIMESEGRRNLMDKQNQMLSQGYMNAYDKAQQAFTQDQARDLQAQQLAEQSKQFGFGQSMAGRELAARYGLEAQRAAEQARQFGYGQQMTAADTAARYGLEGQRAAEQSRQFGYGQQAQQAETAARLRAADQAAAEQSRQYGYGQQMTAADRAAQYGLEGLRAGEQSRQFGATQGLNALQAAASAAQGQGSLGISQNAANISNLNALLGAGATQRGIESEGIAADLAEFNRQRDYPMDMLKFQQSMLQGMPLESRSYAYEQPSNLQQILGTTGGLLELYNKMFPSK